jgi:hypothetical protein
MGIWGRVSMQRDNETMRWGDCQTGGKLPLELTDSACLASSSAHGSGFNTLRHAVFAAVPPFNEVAFIQSHW